MELKETTRDHSGVHNLTFQNDNEDIGIVNQEDLRDSSQRIKNSEHEKNVHTNQEDEFINIESDLHENKHDSADDEKLRLRGLLGDQCFQE